MTIKLDWDNPPEPRQQFLDEAVRQGHGYLLIVEGYPHPTDEGLEFVAPDDQTATERAYMYVCDWIQYTDGKYDFKQKYPSSPFKLYHRDSKRLVKDYTPPTPEELAAGIREPWMSRSPEEMSDTEALEKVRALLKEWIDKSKAEEDRAKRGEPTLKPFQKAIHDSCGAHLLQTAERLIKNCRRKF